MLVGLMLTFISSLYAVSTYCAGFDNAEWQKNYSSEFINYPVNDAWLGSTFSIVEYREHIKPIIQDDYNKEIQAWFLGLYKKGDIIVFLKSSRDVGIFTRGQRLRADPKGKTSGDIHHRYKQY